MNSTEELDQEIIRLKAALYDIDCQRSKVQGILDARKNDQQIMVQKQRQEAADKAAAERAREEEAKRAAAKAAASKKPTQKTTDKGDTEQPSA